MAHRTTWLRSDFTPEEIYNEPKNTFVARFIGESNILDGLMLEDYKVAFADRIYECVDKGFTTNEEVDVVIRPEDIKIRPVGDEYLTGFVESVTFKGVHYEMIVDAYDMKWKIHSTKAAEEGTIVGLEITPEDIHIMRKSVNVCDATMFDNNSVNIMGKTYACEENCLLYNESVQVAVDADNISLTEPDDALLVGFVEALNRRSVFTEAVINCDGKKWVVHTIDPAIKENDTVGLLIDPAAIEIIRTVESELSATKPQEEQ